MGAPNNPSSATGFSAPNSYYNAKVDTSGVVAAITIVAAGTNVSGIFVAGGVMLTFDNTTGTVQELLSIGPRMIAAGKGLIFAPRDGVAIGAANYSAAVYSDTDLLFGVPDSSAVAPGVDRVQLVLNYKVL